MSEKITKFPISYSQRRKNINGPLYVSCQVSGRALQFHKKSHTFEKGEFITIDVMAMQMEDDKPARKICELIVTKEDLLDALNHVSPVE